MSINHADRDHASWSASASARNFACPGALALTLHLPDRTSEAADWGTVAHELGEMCLRDGGDADRFIGTTRKGKVHSFEVDEEMAETAQVYIDYVRKRMFDYEALTGGQAILMIEQRFDLSSLGTPFDAGGTGDAVIWFPKWQELEVVDLKGGRGVVVEVVKIIQTPQGEKKERNPQLCTYGLGAMLANQGMTPDTIRVTIVQPRAPHPDGRIRSETIDVMMDLMDWTFDMLQAMRRSKEAMDAKADLAPAAWAAAYLNPGPHCGSTFCKAAATCPALEQASLDAVGIWFTPEGAPQVANVPEVTDPDERARRLDMLDMIEDWVKQVRAHEHHLAEGGSPATGYGLVRKVGREKWKDGVADQVETACDLAGLPRERFFNPGKLKTPKQVRKELKDKADLVSELSETPTGGTNLVRLDHSMRQEIAAPITSFFTAQNKD